MNNCNACRLSCWELGSDKWYKALARRAKEKLFWEIFWQKQKIL